MLIIFELKILFSKLITTLPSLLKNPASDSVLSKILVHIGNIKITKIKNLFLNFDKTIILG